MSTAICTGLYSARPTFISFSVPPIAKTEAIAPMIKRDLLFRRRGADQVAGLQVLRRAAAIGGGDADHAANRQRQHGVACRRSSPPPETWRRWPSAWRWPCR